MFFSAWVCQHVIWLNEVMLHFIGPLGASAFLLFAVSSGVMSQPWSILGSYLIATLVALLLVYWFVYADGGLLGCGVVADTDVSAALSASTWCSAGVVRGIRRAGHPHTMGIWVLLPIMCNALCLLVCALLFNNLTRVRYRAVRSR